MNNNELELFTIGHSTHPIGQFLSLLQRHEITMLVDVRSHPYSRRMPHFNRDRLTRSLAEVGMDYLFLGPELGARREESECYLGNRADYDRIAATPAFQEGLRRVRFGAGNGRVALMCAEKEPLDCHRTILVCRHLRGELSIEHIHADGSLERHEELERRLVKRVGLRPTLFEPCQDREELIVRAYVERGQQIAYQRPAARVAP